VVRRVSADSGRPRRVEAENAARRIMRGAATMLIRYDSPTIEIRRIMRAGVAVHSREIAAARYLS